MRTISNPKIIEMLNVRKKRILFINVGRCHGAAAMDFLRGELGDDFALFSLNVQSANAKIERIVEDYGDKFTFLISKREPISRFISSYNWDKHNLFLSGNRLKEENAKLFEEFPTVDSLATGLSSMKRGVRDDAHRFAKFGHMGMGQSFYTPANVLEAMPDTAVHVYDVATMGADLHRFCEKMNGESPQTTFPSVQDETGFQAAYPNPDKLFPTKLTKTGHKNLTALLDEDIRIYNML